MTKYNVITCTYCKHIRVSSCDEPCCECLYGLGINEMFERGDSETESIEDKTCDTCKHEFNHSKQYPCHSCPLSKSVSLQWEPKKIKE